MNINNDVYIYKDFEGAKLLPLARLYTLLYQRQEKARKLQSCLCEDAVRFKRVIVFDISPKDNCRLFSNFYCLWKRYI